MGIEKLNEYRIDFENNTSEIFMAASTRAAANARETDALAIAQISRLRTGVGVETPIRHVKFVMNVVGENAAINMCRATPETWVVQEGTPVIFTAIPADGFVFDGWFEPGALVPLSEDLVAELTVEYPGDPAALSTVFEARFSPVP